MTTCPAGHSTTSTDYCDVCGLPVDAAAASAAPAPVAPGPVDPAPVATGAATCPSCSTPNPPNALFCEACGYDFTTGTMPRPLTPPPGVVAPPTASSPSPTPVTPGAPSPPNPSPAPVDAWVAEVWIDPDWYADQQSTDALPSPGVPAVVALRHRSILLGRTSVSRGIHPDVDLGSDPGISRRHAQLTTDGTRWFVEDLGSSNGTYVGSSVGPLPTVPLVAGRKHEIAVDDRVYVGAWTRLVVRRAAPGEA